MSPSSAARDTRNWALRLAFVVTLGLVIETTRGVILPFLAPVLALQLVGTSRTPPKGRMIFLLIVAMAVTSGLAYLVSVMTVGFTGLYALGVGLLYLWGFVLALRQSTMLIGVLVLTMTVVITGIASASTTIASGLALSLTISVAEAFALVFLAYAVFPAVVLNPPQDAPAAADREDRNTPPVAARALLATIVIVPAHVYLNTDGVASMVVLLTMMTMLRQPGIAESAQYSVAFVAGNALGASLAAVAVFFLTLQNHGLVMITVTAAGALILSWQIARGGRWVPVILPGFVAYAVLYGFVLSPLPIADSVAVANRVILIVAGAAYAMAFVSLLLPLLPYLQRLSGARTA